MTLTMAPPEARSHQPTAGDPTAGDAIVRLSRVSKRYGDIVALADVSLEVRPGEIVAMLGPNGAGKTTAISIMLGLRPASAGTVSVFGRPAGDLEARARIGTMLQESGVPAPLRVGEVVDLFRAYYPLTRPVDAILADADLADAANRPVGKLSGGQRQRLYFALALTGDPDLLFLDEPTVGMDVAARHAFWVRVRELAALGKTILFTTHLLEEADAVATRVIVIDHGKILATGSPTEVKARVAGKRVRVRADLDDATIATLPGVRDVRRDGGYIVLTTDDAMPILRGLLALGPRVEEVTVEETGLEAAFLDLTETDR